MTMKNLLLTLASLGLCSLAQAGPVVVTGVTGTGSLNHDPSLIIDHVIPSEGSVWNLADKVYWSGTTPTLTMTFNQIYILQDVLLSVDNNDAYRMEVSLNGTDWSTLFNISSGDGEIGFGMDTMSSDSSHGEYIASINFTASQARYARIFATGGDNSYSVGEVIFAGASIPTAVPEPAIAALLSLGFLGLGLIHKRAQRR